MLSLDSVYGVLAPHLCLACGNEGAVLCDSCVELAGEPIAPRCAGCHKLSAGFKTCQSCRSWLEPYAVYVTTAYEGVYEQLIRALKFDMKRQAAQPIAKMMSDILPDNMDKYLLCPLPTAPARVRERSFDHTKLIAKYFSEYSGLESQMFLGRKTNVRQLGSTRAQRLLQMQDEFFVKKSAEVNGKNILLLDDVVTTGASLSAAAKILKKAGAKRVTAIVFAQKL